MSVAASFGRRLNLLHFSYEHTPMFPKTPARRLAHTGQNRFSANLTNTTQKDHDEAFIGHSYDSNRRRGAYAISMLGHQKSIRPKTVVASSDWHVQLIAILRILRLPMEGSHLVIYSSDDCLMGHLEGGSIWRWKANGWRRANGDPLSNAELLAQIADELEGRSVSFACDRFAPIQQAAQATAQATLRGWRQSTARRASRW